MTFHGRFEGNADPALVERLYEVTLDGGHRAEQGDVDHGGWFAWVEQDEGDFILSVDEMGFISLDTGPVDHAAAEARWEAIDADLAETYQEGWV